MSTAATTPDFDLIARPYRWLEYLTLGNALQRCRTHFLSALIDRKRALVLGDGDGRFLAQLLRANVTLHVDAVDTSAAMLALLRRRCDAEAPNVANRLETHNTNVLTFKPLSSYDLVVTHFLLDCFTQTELEALITSIAPHLEPGALWIVSDFNIPDGPVSPFAQILVRSLYLAFRILTGLRTTHLPDHAAALNSGFACIAHHHSLGGILTTELWQKTSPRVSRSL